MDRQGDPITSCHLDPAVPEVSQPLGFRHTSQDSSLGQPVMGSLSLSANRAPTHKGAFRNGSVPDGSQVP